MKKTTDFPLLTPISLNEMESYFDRLWPICRSISGNGLRQSFEILQELIPLELKEYPTGMEVFDWEIPKEWNIREAYIITPDGEKICDFQLNNLHIVNYSIPFEGELTWDELKEHIYTLPQQPDAIPYITSYYKETWGFCMDFNTHERISKNGTFKIKIDSDLKPGSITVGSVVLKGNTDEEILLSTYLCHPSMANNELSGPLCMAYLYQQIKAIPNRRYTYRFVVAPETIGVIAYLFDHGKQMKAKTKGGFVMTCCGDEAPFVFKQSKNPKGWLEKITTHVLKHHQAPHSIIPFAVGGSDERQYCSPGFNLPVGSITRSMYHRYAQYHTSLDNKDFISFSAMSNSVGLYYNIIQTMEDNVTPICLVPFGEPRMGKRNLLPSSIEPNDKRRKDIDRMFHLICWSDGEHDLIDIAEKREETPMDYRSILERLIEEKIIALHG
jgi:aminopeptidase-like protein